MTELEDIIPSGSYLSAKTNQPGEVFIIIGFASEKSRFKEGHVNLVLTLTDSEGDEKKVTLNAQSRKNIANAYGRTLEKWIGQSITIANIRPTAYGNTLDFTAAATPQKKPEITQQQKAIAIIEQAGKNGIPVKAAASAFMAAFSISEEGANTLVQGMKNEGWIVEKNNKLVLS